MSRHALRGILMTATFFLHIGQGDDLLWENWWDYKGISGPQFWGYINPEWTMCSKGRNQSPVNLDPSTLLFDPSLSPLDISGDTLTGTVLNNGHDVTFYVRQIGNYRWGGVDLKGGPLSYTYRVDQIKFRFGLQDKKGSEHTVDFNKFPVEIQILAYNTELYSGYTEAESSALGLAAIAVFAQVNLQGVVTALVKRVMDEAMESCIPISDRHNEEFSVIQRAVNRTLYKGDSTVIERLRLQQLLPSTDQYVTYEGSITFPPCQETVTWIIYNRPIYISKDQLSSLRSLRQGTRKNPITPMAGNFRPSQSLNRRTVRTNIEFGKNKCKVAYGTHYTVNDFITGPDTIR